MRRLAWLVWYSDGRRCSSCWVNEPSPMVEVGDTGAYVKAEPPAATTVVTNTKLAAVALLILFMVVSSRRVECRVMVMVMV